MVISMTARFLACPVASESGALVVATELTPLILPSPLNLLLLPLLKCEKLGQEDHVQTLDLSQLVYGSVISTLIRSPVWSGRRQS